MLSARSTVREPIHDVSILIKVESKWASIHLSACLLFSEWASVPTVDSLSITSHMGPYIYI
jgi:hypothetical protein